MSTPRLLDLFCGAGGAAMGYHRAGFDVVGVDIEPQPHYPFEFYQADALTFPLDEFDTIHASPPCQAFTTMSNRWRGAGGRADQHPDLIAATRERAKASELPWIMENVVGAVRSMRATLLLDGSMFALGVHRPRLFESNVLLLAPGRGGSGYGKIGVYGRLDGRRLNTRSDGSEQRAAASLGQAQAAMGIDWMPWDQLREAIPPAYTEYLGRQLLQYLEAAA